LSYYFVLCAVRDGTKTVSSKTKTVGLIFNIEPKSKTVNSIIKTTQDSTLLTFQNKEQTMEIFIS